MIDCHTDVILSMSFNTDGSLLATSCKDKKMRVIEPRSGAVLQVRGGSCCAERCDTPEENISVTSDSMLCYCYRGSVVIFLEVFFQLPNFQIWQTPTLELWGILEYIYRLSFKEKMYCCSVNQKNSCCN